MTGLDWQRIAEAHVHPVRLGVIRTMLKSPPDGLPGWSPVMLARALDELPGNVSYHVNELARMGLIEQIGTRHVRGAVQHFYAFREGEGRR